MAAAIDRYLTKIYYNPSHPAAFGKNSKLFNAAKEDGKDISHYQIKNWLRKQETHTLFKEPRDKIKRPRVVVPRKYYQFDVDTAHLVKYKKSNDDYSYILICIDIFTRYTWTVALKRLTGKEMVSALEQVFAEAKPKVFRSDGGSENTNKVVKKYLEDEGVKRVITRNETKANYAERVIKTLKTKLTKYMYHKQTHRWIDVLPLVTKSYNSSYHSAIQQTPLQALDANNIDLWNIQYAPKKRKMKMTGDRAPPQKSIFKLQVGDVVRLSRMKHAFTRAYDERWTHELFIITDMSSQQAIPQYTLKAWNNDPIDGLFYEEELEKVFVDNKTKYKIAKRVPKKTNGIEGYNVKWYGWGPQYDTWIPKSSITNI